MPYRRVYRRATYRPRRVYVRRPNSRMPRRRTYTAATRPRFIGS